MTFFDGLMLLLFVLFVLRGVWVGLVGQLAFLTALVLGFLAAGTFHADLAGLIAPWIKQPQFAFLLTYSLLFLAVYLITILVGRGLRLVMNITMLVWFDRTMGGIFGAIKGIFVASLLFMGLAGFVSGSQPLLRSSFSYPFLAVCSGYIILFVRDNDLRERFLPRELAIREAIALPIPVMEAAGGTTEQESENNELIQ
jgi:membrane protein required for colicin V production